MRKLVATTLFVGLVGTVASAADLHYDNALRRVSIYGLVLGDEPYFWSESDAPEDPFAPFDAYLYDGTQIGELYAYSSASQNSVIDDTLIAAAGDAWATRSSPAACLASASSDLFVVFHVETETTIRLSGELTTDYEPEPIGEAFVMLFGDEALLFEAWAWEEDTDFAFVYTLVPGTSYTFIAYARVDMTDKEPTEPCESTSTFDVTLSVAEDQDCNENGIHDWLDIFEGTSGDCNGNWVPDECDIADGTSEDCNGNGIPDECIELENDCNDNGVPDECDVPPICNEGPPVCSLDCQADLVPDECQLEGNDCNGNGIPDECDIAEGTSQDENGNGIPDECEFDCEANELAKLLASDGTAGDYFGYSVGIDDDMAIVGAPEDGTGWAYVFHLNGSDWIEEARLLASDGQSADRFGCSVAIDGDIAIVGADDDDHAAGTDAGSAYIFQRDHGGPGNWGQVVKLAPPDLYNIDNFGRSVGISGDTAIVGMRGDDDGASPNGAAYVFQRDYGGPDNWGQVAKLTASDGGYQDQLGHCVSIDGDVAVAGAPQDPWWSGGVGKAYVFQRDHGGPDNWGEVVRLTASDAAEEDHFGWSVSISGETAVVGTYGAGSAYIFQRNQGGPDNWGQVVILTPSDGPGSSFGRSVAIDADNAVVGWYGADSAYVFRYDGTWWYETAKLLASDATAGDHFGCAVAVSADSAMIGAERDDDSGSNCGSGYLFRGLSDCNANTGLDICDIAHGLSEDNNGNGIPDECELPGDLDGDGDVDLSDLAQLLSNYGMTEGATYEDGDLDGDGDVDLSDLAGLLANYGIGT